MNFWKSPTSVHRIDFIVKVFVCTTFELEKTHIVFVLTALELGETQHIVCNILLLIFHAIDLPNITSGAL